MLYTAHIAKHGDRSMMCFWEPKIAQPSLTNYPSKDALRPSQTTQLPADLALPEPLTFPRGDRVASK